jgi:predicted TIM-barrel fold metal-dependent hydrolase
MRVMKTPDASAGLPCAPLPREVIDSHIHFFQTSLLTNPAAVSGHLTPDQAARMRERFARNLAERGQPPMDTTLVTPEDYARAWGEQFDRHGVAAGVFLSLVEDPEPLAAFVRRDPARFIPYAWVNPLDPEAPSKLERQVRDHGARGLKLITTNQWFHPWDERAYPVYGKCVELGIPLLVHCGVSIGYMADFRYANPLELQPVLRDFPDLPVLLAHFGAGFFREALLLCYQCRNILLDTSSSNIWMKYQDTSMTIRDVFARALDAAGPERIVFGTDSSYFPRGFRRDIFDEQHDALMSLGLPQGDLDLIFSGNIRRLLGLREPTDRR